MKDRNQKIIESKERLAADVLVVAEDALQDIKACMGDAGVKDLIQIFSALGMDLIEILLASGVDLVDVDRALGQRLLFLVLTLLINKVASNSTFCTDQLQLVGGLQFLHAHLQLVLQLSH